MNNKKIIIILVRLLFLAIFIFPFFYLPIFYKHFFLYLRGNIINYIFVSQWKIVVISIIGFLLFLIPLSYRRKVNWLEYGLVGGFFISLFIEMYGIPLTILLAAKYFSVSGVFQPDNILSFPFLGTVLAMDLPMAYGAVIIAIGAVLIIIGWITLYLNSKNKKITQTGIYKYSRHPQYFGFILVIFGWFIGWPTFLTLFMSPILIYKYITVCFAEQREMSKIDPDYQKYCQNTPFFL